MTGLTINHDLCCHCGACIASCPFSALREEEGRVVAGAECRLCRSCVEVCPVSAITVEEGENRIDLSGWRGILVYLQLEEGKLHPVSLEMLGLAHDLARRIESELEYPGQIKVHVLRETKVVEYAK